jgi:molybdate transport system regulatory protein
MRTPTVRFRIDFGPRCSVGIGKVQLLETIADSGSLSQAARALRMSYRRAWLLLQDLNDSFDEPVACTSVGGRGGGGVALTAFGRRLVQDYRSLELRIEELAALQLRHASAHAGVPAMAADAAGLSRRSVARGSRARPRRGD